MRPGLARALAFGSGACVLVLELVGTRLLSPVFGSTVYVWSALITVTLAALAGGAWLGGQLADRPRPERWPARLCAAAGLWLAAVPFARKLVLAAAAALGLKAGSLCAALALVGPPLAALGALAPLCVRLCARSLDGLGRAAGGVSALSTAGSVAGALAAGFWLLPLLSAVLLVEAVAALLLASAALLAWPGARGAAAAAAVLLAAAAAGRATPRAGSPLHLVVSSEDSLYGSVRVVDRLDWNRRVLYIDGVANTVVDLKDQESTSDYLLAFELPAALRPGAERALVIGLGGGSIVGRLARHGIACDVSEVDPTILRAARDWFGFRPTGKVWLEDGRRVLERGGADYDLIYFDAFAGDQNPEHLLSLEAFQAARRRLKPGGMAVVNIIARPEGPRAGMARAVKRTLGEVFPSVRSLVSNRGVDWSRGVVNLIFFASDEPFAPAYAGTGLEPRLAAWYNEVQWQWVDPGPGGALVTDDRNPLAALSAPGMAEMRSWMLQRREGVDL